MFASVRKPRVGADADEYLPPTADPGAPGTWDRDLSFAPFGAANGALRGPPHLDGNRTRQGPPTLTR
jgi:hypothetical protein